MISGDAGEDGQISAAQHGALLSGHARASLLVVKKTSTTCRPCRRREGRRRQQQAKAMSRWWYEHRPRTRHSARFLVFGPEPRRKNARPNPMCRLRRGCSEGPAFRKRPYCACPARQNPLGPPIARGGSMVRRDSRQHVRAQAGNAGRVRAVNDRAVPRKVPRLKTACVTRWNIAAT